MSATATKPTLTELERLIALSPDIMCIVSFDGTFKSINPAVTDVLGWAVDEVVGRNFIDFVHPEDQTATMEEFERIVVAGKPTLQFENRYGHRDGSWHTVSWRSAPRTDGIVVATARDMTDTRRQEQQIHALNAELAHHASQLEAANKEIESFAYSVAHDLRTPLRSIDGFSQAILEDCGESLGDDGRAMLQRVRSATQRMSQLIDDLLELSRVSRSTMEPSRVDLSALAQAVAHTLRDAEPHRSVEFRIAPHLAVYGDQRLLRIVLENLLGNAWKFTGNLPRPAVIEFGMAGDGEFFVRDNGAGFDMEYAAKLFQPFQRLHTLEEFPGTGIGLATVQRLIQRHGGRAWAEGAVGKGATIHFTLGPAASATATDAPIVPSLRSSNPT